MFQVQVKNEGIAPALARIAAGTRSPRALMRAIAGTLEAETEKNFAAQGRPKWLGLAPRTAQRRGAGAKILQDTGQLAASITTDYGNDFALVGSNKPYAPIQHFGGQTGAHVILPRLKKALAFAGRVVKRVNHPGSKIPARPFLPAGRDGSLQPEARAAVEADVQNYLRGLIR